MLVTPGPFMLSYELIYNTDIYILCSWSSHTKELIYDHTATFNIRQPLIKFRYLPIIFSMNNVKVA